MSKTKEKDSLLRAIMSDEAAYQEAGDVRLYTEKIISRIEIENETK